MEIKKTMVIGASPKPERYSYKAINLLQKFGHSVEAIGLKNGKIGNIEIQTGLPKIPDINTISLYIAPQRQKGLYNYIIELKPKRIIFNPGTENSELENMAIKAGIEVIENCTLVMLNTGRF